MHANPSTILVVCNPVLFSTKIYQENWTILRNYLVSEKHKTVKALLYKIKHYSFRSVFAPIIILYDKMPPNKIVFYFLIYIC